MTSTFGAETQFFFELTPERILRAVETTGLRCTGRVLQLNSMENRVFEVEVEVDEVSVKSTSDRFRVVKFYRPGRWSRDQIEQEHQFLRDLVEAEIPVIAPIRYDDGNTVHHLEEIGILFAVFPRRGGRAPDEVTDELAARLGRLVARLHTIGARRVAPDRVHLTPSQYGLADLALLHELRVLPPEFQGRYERAVHSLCEIGDDLYKGVDLQRIHGDCHLGNVLVGSEGLFLVDFDDMVMGPAVQDLWLFIPGIEPEDLRLREIVLSSYEELRRFDRREVRLIELLRALRYLHLSAWIAKRWHDPAFPRAFPHFGTNDYWRDRVADLEEQVRRVKPPTGEGFGSSSW